MDRCLLRVCVGHGQDAIEGTKESRLAMCVAQSSPYLCCHCVHCALTSYFLDPRQLPVRCDKTGNDVVVDNRRHNQLRDLAWSIVKQQEDPAERSRVRREDAAALLTHEVRRLISTRA